MAPHRSNRNWRSLGWWFQDSSTGETVLFQPPNLALTVAQAATAVQRLDLLPGQAPAVGRIKSGALVIWGLDEVGRGTTPFRRVLGAAVLGWQVRRLVR